VSALFAVCGGTTYLVVHTKDNIDISFLVVLRPIFQLVIAIIQIRVDHFIAWQQPRRVWFWLDIRLDIVSRLRWSDC